MTNFGNLILTQYTTLIQSILHSYMASQSHVLTNFHLLIIITITNKNWGQTVYGVPPLIPLGLNIFSNSFTSLNYT